MQLTGYRPAALAEQGYVCSACLKTPDVCACPYREHHGIEEKPVLVHRDELRRVGVRAVHRSEPLLHNTAKPLGALHVFEQVEGMKPRGLWYGVGDAWLDWCRAEMSEWIRGHTYEITLREDAKVLRLDNVGAILDFHEEYVSTAERWACPDWIRLATTHDGIEIAPYQWALRLDPKTMWYYGWDCASGCIWNPRAIASVREIEAAVRAGGALPTIKTEPK